MNRREQDIKDDNAFFRNVIIVVFVMMTITVVMLWYGGIEWEEFKTEFESWDCGELKDELENDHPQQREQMILKKLHTEDCYGN